MPPTIDLTRDFDRLRQLSLSGDINEDHVRSVAVMTYVVTAGQLPFLQYNLPYRFKPLDIGEVAESVVSTVKSGFFRVASGVLFGGASREEQEQEERQRVRGPEPEQKLAVAHCLRDPSKVAEVMELSPDGLHLALVDNQNRLILLDAASGVILSLWKGYHHAQIGWLPVHSKETPASPVDMFDRGTKSSCLLVTCKARNSLSFLAKIGIP